MAGRRASPSGDHGWWVGGMDGFFAACAGVGGWAARSAGWMIVVLCWVELGCLCRWFACRQQESSRVESSRVESS